MQTACCGFAEDVRLAARVPACVIAQSRDRFWSKWGTGSARCGRDAKSPSTSLVAERAGVSRKSVWAVEKGSASVAIGIYLKVLHALNFDRDLLKICADDPLGRFLQDERDDRYAREEEPLCGRT